MTGRVSPPLCCHRCGKSYSEKNKRTDIWAGICEECVEDVKNIITTGRAGYSPHPMISATPNELWLKTHKEVTCPWCKKKTWANFKETGSDRPTSYSTRYTFLYEGICDSCKKPFSFTGTESWHDGNMRNDVGYVPKWLTED